MSEEKYDSPGVRMDKLMLELKKKRSIAGIRAAVSEVLQASPADMKEFSHRIGNHRWRGIVYLKRNSLLGSIFSIFDAKLYVVRGYGKIKYSDDSRVYNRECITQNKYDGTNLGIFCLPDGTMMGKTRMIESWLGMAWKRKNLTWEGLFGMIENGDLRRRINELLINHDYVVYGELYGSLNKGEFVKYSVEIAFKVFDILDRKKQRFLPPVEVYRLCEFYNLPVVEQTWSGILTDKEIQRIEFELKDLVKDDGYEGFVAKTVIDDDVYMAKLKCDEVKEKCWSISGKKPSIPVLVLRKAVRKILDNFPEAKTIEDMEPHVLDELREEVEEKLLQESIDRIRESIRYAITPSDEDLLKLVVEKMQEMKTRGIDLHNKGHVLSNLSSALGTIRGGKLYTLYNQALRQLKE